MWKINKLTDVHRDAVASYDGFLSCLVYSSANTEFRKAIRNHWDAINQWSGRSLLILVADGMSVRPRGISRPNSDDSFITQMMVKMPGLDDDSSPDQVNIEIASHFGIKRTDLPCIVFFDGVEQPKTLIYKFLSTDDLIKNLMTIFQDCQETWELPPQKVQEDRSALRSYRENMLERLRPILNRRRFVRLVKNLSHNPTFAAFIGALSPASWFKGS